ncbi:MAG: tRNA pseudouridine(55) synthase TruB [Clostridiales bacterium]|nr:tRNA pseudouridine(55) synthase TruB [Clostridiales bacterium]
MMKNKGIIAINKPSGWTSFDVVNKLKYMLKPLKTGHLGTLDPMATGVLLVTVGKATKLFDLMQKKKKTYLAQFTFGYETDTLDSTGVVMSTTDIIPTEKQIKQVLPMFIGKISQIPPKYSAKSINGARAYSLARQNIDFELKPKVVDIYDIRFVSYINKILTLSIECGSGTYIRAIGRDLAEKLNSKVTMTSLVRTKVDKFSIENCQDIHEINRDNVFDRILPIQEFIDYPTLKVDAETHNKLLNGQKLQINKNDGVYQLKDDADTLALVEIHENQAKMSVFLG